MHTKDIGEVMQLQSDFLRNQFGVATDQFKKMTGGAASKDTSKKTPTWFRAPDRPNELAYGQSTSIDVARHVSVAAGLADRFCRRAGHPRMALAAHLEGLMNGTFLIALGAVWQFVIPRPCGSGKIQTVLLAATNWCSVNQPLASVGTKWIMS
jgi:hypothetical protein